MDPSLAKAWLEFLSALVWPSVVAVCVYYFRNELKALVGRVAHVKIGGAEIVLQTPEKAAPPPKGEASVLADLIGPDGYYTTQGLAKVVASSGLVTSDEVVKGNLLIFETKNQHTWLLATRKQLFCVLDDQDTRFSGRLIQWHIPLNDAQPVHARSYKKTAGLLDIGKHANWLYSTALFSDPKKLKEAVLNLLQV